MRKTDNMLLHLSVFSAVSGLELSMSKDHHQCKLLFVNPCITTLCLVLL